MHVVHEAPASKVEESACQARRPSTFEGSAETVAAPGRESETSREVFHVVPQVTVSSPIWPAEVKLEDFDHVDWKTAEYDDEELAEFKTQYLGRELPQPRVSEEKLRALGWQGPNPWATCWLSSRMLNS